VQVLENLFPETALASPDLLAHHCAQANMVEKAVGYWGEAGRQAIARSAMVEAASHLRQALERLPALPDTPAWWRCELDLQTALGPALIATKGYSVFEIGEVYNRARVLCERLGDTPRLVPIASGQCLHHLYRGETEAALEVAEELLCQAQRTDSLEARISAHWQMGATLIYMGNLRQARLHLEVAADIVDRAGESAAEMANGQRTLVALPIYCAMLLLLLGHYDQARTQSTLSLAVARSLKLPNSVASTLGMDTWLHLYLGEDAPDHLVDELNELAVEQGFSLWAAQMPLLRGMALVRAGEVRQGVSLVRQSAAQYEALGAATPALAALWLAAGVAGGVEGRALIDESVQLEHTSGIRFLDAEVCRIRGALLADEGDVATAEAQFTKAIGIAQGQGAKHWELRAATSLAQLWRDQGRCIEARDLLAPVYGWFNEGLGTPDLRRAKALLNQLE